jgi:hypothetical protein
MVMQECPKRTFFVIKSVIKLCCRKVRGQLAFNFFSMNVWSTVGCKKKVKTKTKKGFIHNCMLYKKGQDRISDFCFFLSVSSLPLCLACLVLSSLLELCCVAICCLFFSSVVLCCVLCCIVLLCRVVLCCVVLSSLVSCLVLSSV